ncbi:MAG: type II toxin-antitoxin system PemK/MazF family toxin [Candidatus Promineofilum sp.]|nr:type II toxin-antitoxin system PemK/MazF family toxin [Promineifilum sp.]
MVINQGDVFWIDLGEPFGSEPGYRHPHVIIQNDSFNHSRINTVVVCAMTTNMALAVAPGNVRLEKGEANLPEASVVNITQVLTVDKRRLGEKIGSLSAKRLQQILGGIYLLLQPIERSGR